MTDYQNQSNNITYSRLQQDQDGTKIYDSFGRISSSSSGILINGYSGVNITGNDVNLKNTWNSGLNTNATQTTLSGGTDSAQVTLNDSQASLTKRSSVTGNIHGVTVTDTETTITGGTTSTQMTLNDETVDFKHVASGAPVRLTGIADGVNRYDAVNKGQLDALRAEFSGMEQRLQRDAAQGIAGLAAINNAPLPSAAGKITMALGAGSYKGYNATGISFAYRAGTNLKGAVFNGGAGFNGGDPVIKVGVAWELN